MVAEYLVKVADDPVAALKDSFVKCNKEMSPWSTMMGTTAVILLMIANKRYVANLGDSKAILSQHGRLAFASKDHKASDPEERQRVIDMGGTGGLFFFFLFFFPSFSFSFSFLPSSVEIGISCRANCKWESQRQTFCFTSSWGLESGTLC